MHRQMFERMVRAAAVITLTAMPLAAAGCHRKPEPKPGPGAEPDMAVTPMEPVEPVRTKYAVVEPRPAPMPPVMRPEPGAANPMPPPKPKYKVVKPRPIKVMRPVVPPTASKYTVAAPKPPVMSMTRPKPRMKYGISRPRYRVIRPRYRVVRPRGKDPLKGL